MASSVLVCGLSGEVIPAGQAVLSPQSGAIFHRALITKHLEAFGTDPTNNQPLSPDQLIPITAPAQPPALPNRPSSVSGLLSQLQSEWEATLLELFSLRQQLASTRQQLSHALYQHDAACRVIARLITERDDAHKLLAEARLAQPPSNGPDESDGDSAMLPAEFVQQVTECKENLMKGRKQRWKNPGPELRKSDEIYKYEVIFSQNLHSASQPGILACDVHQDSNLLVVTGGVDGRILISDPVVKHTINLSTKKEHDKAVRDVRFLDSGTILSGSDDTTVKLWKGSIDDSFSVAQQWNVHSGAVRGIAIHPSGNFAGACSDDGSWSILDVGSGALISRFSSEKRKSCKSIEFHPDGALAAIVSGSSIDIWNMEGGSTAPSVHLSHDDSAELTAFAFCGNGYYAASSDANGLVKLWDLRKNQIFQEMPIQEASSLSFNPSGHYLCVGADSVVSIFSTDSWNRVKSLQEHRNKVTAVRMSQHGDYLASCGLDRKLLVYSAPDRQ